MTDVERQVKKLKRERRNRFKAGIKTANSLSKDKWSYQTPLKFAKQARSNGVREAGTGAVTATTSIKRKPTREEITSPGKMRANPTLSRRLPLKLGRT